MLEREVKLAVPAAFELPDLDNVVASINATPPDEKRLETIYFDTPDLRLTRWGCSLRLRQGEGWTVKLPTAAPGPTLSRRELEFEGSGNQPPEAATNLVMAYIRHATLVPVVSLSTLRRKVQLRNGDGGVLVEVVDDDVTVIQGLRIAGRFREVEVELRDAGGDQMLDAVLNRLRAAGAAESGNQSKLVRALGARATAPPEVAPTPLTPAGAAGELVRHTIATSVATLLQHDPGVRLGDDPEDVHRARVATRRLRSQLRTFRGLVDPDWADSLREELRWVADGLGQVRDRQVMAQRLRDHAGALAESDAAALSELAGQLEAESSEARGRLVLDMRSDRYVELLERLVEAARTPALLPEAHRPAKDVAPGLAKRDWKKLRKAVDALSSEPSDPELHGIRILAKRARYAAEMATPVIGKPAARFAEMAAALQDILGDHQDSVTLQPWLREAGQGRVAFVAGELSAIERQTASVDRAKWHRAWKKLDRKRLKRWMI